MAIGYSVVVLAAGHDESFGSGSPLKEKVGGKAVLSHSLDLFDESERCVQMLVAGDAVTRDWIAGDPLTFTSTKMKAVKLEQGIAGIIEQATEDIVVVHDAARPNIKNNIVDRLLSAIRPEIGAVAGWPVYDQAVFLTEIGEDGSGNGEPPTNDDFLGPKQDHRLGHVMEFLDRSGLFAVQSPQAYYRKSLLTALQSAGKDLDHRSDLCTIYMEGGFEVAVVRGSLSNLRLNSPDELGLLHKLMGTQRHKKKDRYGGLGW